MNEYGNKIQDPTNYLINKIESYLKNQRSDWASVCKLYAKIKENTF
jgi:hypothetical protein